MSLAEQITALTTDKTNIRNAILDKGGTCPSENGFDDFATDIATIPSGGLEYKATAAELDATLASAYIGHIYEYTGTNTNTYKNGRLYLVKKRQYLCFTAQQANSTVQIISSRTPTKGQSFEFSMDGENWSAYTLGDTITLASIGDNVYWKGNNSTFSESSDTYLSFSLGGLIAASGSIMSLLDETCELTTISTEYCFYRMFYNCDSLIMPPELPATTLASDCYSQMFYNCTALVSAPELPATTLATYCYYRMFDNCTALVSAPELPATTLATGCYREMFANCTALVSAPELPATTLATYCYYGMFYNCDSLIMPPELPATTLASYCYSHMFYNCTALVSAPELPATTLATYCYYGMFRDCTSLIYVPLLPATTLTTYCYREMFYYCKSLYVSDTSGTGYDKAWRIPTSGEFVNTMSQYNTFYRCLGTRSSNNMPGAAGSSYTYYTQNDPI